MDYVLKDELDQFWKNAKKEMKQLYEKIKQHPLTCLICIIVIIIALLSLIVLPYWRVTQFGITNPKDFADAENSYRATIAQILGGIAVAIGIYFAWGNLTTAREGQITERFTRAVDQLGATDENGNQAIEVRLGGIYALERIANESEKDYWPIMEILTAYIRKNSSVEISKSQCMVSFDIQAIFNVIGRRKKSLHNGETKRLNLRGTCLQEADLEGAHLEGADFKNSHLERAHFYNAHLEGADFENSHLEGADLDFANLEGSRLFESHLEGANLFRANFEGAHLWKAHLEGAYFDTTYFKGADLGEANFQGAIYLKINDISKAETLYNAKLDEELEKQLREKYPVLFDAPKDE